MKLFRRILSTILGLLSLAGLGCSSAAINHTIDLTLGQTHTFNHLYLNSYNYPGAFSDSGTFELTNPGSVVELVSDNELSSTADILNVSAYTLYGNNTNTFSSSKNLVYTVIPLSGLAAGVYTLQFVGKTDGIFGADYDVTVSAEPLSAAAWLFGVSLLGFVAYNARRTV
jgi:hypothetical protein